MDSRLSNLYIPQKATTINYTPVSGMGGKGKIPFRVNRRLHSERLEFEFTKAWQSAEKNYKIFGTVSVPSRHGVYLEIKGQEGYDLITKSLENITQHVRLCNVKTEIDENNNETVFSTVFVPEDKRDFFLKKLNKYKEVENSETVVGTIEDNV